jgi:hypothetical protein
MTRRNAHTRRIGMALLVLVALSFPAYAEGPPPADKWTFGVQPYLWLPSISGDLNYSAPGGSPSVDVSSDTLLDELDFAFMLNAEARKGRWAIVTDFIYLDLDGGDSKVKSVTFSGPGGLVEVPVNVTGSVDATLAGVVWQLAGAYTVAGNEHTSLDVLLGFRYFGIEATTDWNLSGTITGPGPGQSFARTGSIKESDDLWDGIVGIRGRIGLGSGKWGIPYYLDAHLAGGGRHPVPVEPDRPEPDVPLPVLRHGKRQAAAERELPWPRARREFPVLKGGFR